MKNCKVNVTCKGCRKPFTVSPSRAGKSVFCNRKCYFANQDKRKQSIRKTDHPIKVGDCFGKLTITNIIGAKSYVRCDCGQERIYQSLQLLRGGLKSCGCELYIRKRKDGPLTAWNQWYRYLFYSAKYRDIKFDLSFADVQSICTKKCTYCGIEPQQWTGCKDAYLGYYTKRTVKPDLNFAESKIIYINGIDRIDSSKGYEINNTVTACRFCNLAKLDRSIDEFKIWAKRLYEWLFTPKVL